MDSTDKPTTPKGITMSGDIGHILYLNHDLTLDDITKALLEEKKWVDDKKLVRDVLEDYIKARYVSLDQKTGKYNMTESGILSFMSGWW